MAKQKTTKNKIGPATTVKTRNREIDHTGFTHNQSDMMNQKDIPSVKLANNKKAKRDGVKAWWLQPKEKIGQYVNEVVSMIDMQNEVRRASWKVYAKLYGSYNSMSFGSRQGFGKEVDNRPTVNVIQESIDTINSKIAKDNPAPYFVSNGGGWHQKVKTEYLTKFTQAAFNYMRFYDKANNNVLRDSELYGIGGMKFFIQDNKPQCEWVFINEIKVDEYDAYKQAPRSMHQTKLMTKERALALFNSDEQVEIIEAVMPTMPKGYSSTRWSVVDLVAITESWHLPSSQDAKDGIHCFTINDKTLDYELYEKDYFPFVFHRWYLNALGWYGRGIAEQLKDKQYEINKLLIKIKHAQETACVPFFLLPMGGDLAEESVFNNEMMRGIYYNASGGAAPTVVSPQALSGEVYQHLKDLINWSFQEAGITQTAASGQKQVGIDSAVALRTMVDMESSRFIQPAKNWNQFHKDSASMLLRICDELSEDDHDTDITFPFFDKKGRSSRQIAYKKYKLAESDYTIRCDLASSVPDSLSGRFQTISDWIQNNYLSKERGLQMLNEDPDLQREIELQTATLNLVEKHLMEMTEDDNYTPPDPYMNLALAKQVSQSTLVLLQSQDCPEDKLDNVRTYIDAILNLINTQPDNTAALQSSYAPPNSQIQPPPGPGMPLGPTAPQQPIQPQQ